MQYLIDQAANDLRDARQHLIYSIASYRVAKRHLGAANRQKLGPHIKAHIMTRLNKSRAQLKRDIRAAENALDWYQSVKIGLLAEYRRTL